MVEGRIYVQAPKRYHYEYFVLKRPTPVGKQERNVELSGHNRDRTCDHTTCAFVMM